MNRTAVRFVTISGILLCLIVLGYLVLESWNADGPLLKPENQRLTQIGSRIYSENCASCHGVNLEGQVKEWRSPNPDGRMPAPPHDETGHTWHHGDEVLFKITKLGVVRAANLENYKSAMPAYEGILSDEEIIAVLSFIKSKWPEEVQKRHDALNAQLATQANKKQ